MSCFVLTGVSSKSVGSNRSSFIKEMADMPGVLSTFDSSKSCTLLFFFFVRFFFLVLDLDIWSKVAIWRIKPSEEQYFFNLRLVRFGDAPLGNFIKS